MAKYKSTMYMTNQFCHRCKTRLHKTKMTKDKLWCDGCRKFVEVERMI